MSPTPWLSVEQVSKSFGRAQALRSLSLTLEQGRVYGLAGQNGAGKSTLVKILSGVHRPDLGQIRFEGAAFAPADPAQAEQAGISVFHQEIPVCPSLSVAANVFLGTPELGARVFPNQRDLERRCGQLFRELLQMELDTSRLMGQCTVAERQLALLVRALSRRARLIILDEPTTALTPPEVSKLFAAVRRLAAQGITFIFVSHLLDELMALSDELFVLRDGLLVGHLQRDRFDVQQLSNLIAGRTLEEPAPSLQFTGRGPKLLVQALSRAGEFHDVSFSLNTGEILGIAGLQGSGRSAIARALFGAPPADRGEIKMNGEILTLQEPRDAIRAGLGYVPEDRKSLGLFDDLDIASNLGILQLDSLSRGPMLSRSGLRELTLQMQRQLQIKMPDPQAAITSLSGGNQQKVLIARWLAIRPQVLVMNEPTRGVDVGAKDEICRLLQSLAGDGCAFVISSSDLDELLRLADRILVMNRGRIAAEFPRGAATKQRLIHASGTTLTSP